MTREEAITYLNVIWNRYKAEYEIERETLDAYHMAIEALHHVEAEAKGYCHRIKPKEDANCDCVTVVRCKDCKHYNIPIGEDGWTVCPMNIAEQPNAFCSRGERREK